MSDDEATTRPRRRSAAQTQAKGPATGRLGDPPASTGTAPSFDSPAIAEDGSAIQADHVEVRMGAVGRVDSGQLHVLQGAVGGARADSVSVQQGAIGGVVAGEASVRQGFARSILARSVRVEQSFVRTLVAAEVNLERTTVVGVLLARRVAGDVRVLVDWRGALAFGAAFGLVAGLLRRRRRAEEG
jgi:hypothetical protein